jgi:phosphoribosylcarboxyaminoimidazole (NCAIR) mutase
MPKEKIVVLMGSKSDYAFASRIGAFLEEAGFPVSCEYNRNMRRRKRIQSL